MKIIKGHSSPIMKICCECCEEDESLLIERYKHFHEDEDEEGKMTYFFSFDFRLKYKFFRRLIDIFNFFRNFKEYRLKGYASILITLDQLQQFYSELINDSLNYGIVDNNSLKQASLKKIKVKHFPWKKGDNVSETVFYISSDNFVFSADCFKREDNNLQIHEFEFGWNIRKNFKKRNFFIHAIRYLFNKEKWFFQTYDGIFYEKDLITFLSTMTFIIDNLKEDKKGKYIESSKIISG